MYPSGCCATGLDATPGSWLLPCPDRDFAFTLGMQVGLVVLDGQQVPAALLGDPLRDVGLAGQGVDGDDAALQWRGLTRATA